MLTVPVWIGIYSNIINGCTYAIGAIGLMFILSRPDVGHRLLLRLLAIFSMLRMIVCFTLAWDNYHQQISRTTSIFCFTSSVVGLALISYVLMRIKDIIQTFIESEQLDRMRADGRADAEQGRVLQTYLSAQTRQRSESLMMSHPSIR